LLLHIFAQNLACGLVLWFYVWIDYNITKIKPKMAAAAILDFCTNTNISASV